MVILVSPIKLLDGRECWFGYHCTWWWSFQFGGNSREMHPKEADCGESIVWQCSGAKNKCQMYGRGSLPIIMYFSIQKIHKMN